MYETHSGISTLLWEENEGACGGNTQQNRQVTTALPELCNHNTNNNSAVHATRCVVWPLAQTVRTAQCQNWQDHQHRKLNSPDFFPVGDASEGVDPTE